MTRVPDTNPYGFVAGAIAGRRVATEWSDNNGHRVYSDGQSIFLPLDDQEAGPLLWATITAQAALIGAGSLHASLLASLVGRPVLAKRYLYLEMLRAAHVLAHRLPWAFTQRLQSQPPRSHSARGSLELAATPLELPEPPAYFGHQASGGLRTAVGAGGLAALTRPQPQRLTSRAPAELEAGDEGEASQLLRLFQNPFAAGNPLSDLLNAILGAGVSKRHRQAETGEGGAEIMARHSR